MKGVHTTHTNVPITLNGIEVGRGNVRVYVDGTVEVDVTKASGELSGALLHDIDYEVLRRP